MNWEVNTGEKVKGMKWIKVWKNEGEEGREEGNRKGMLTEQIRGGK
jgi:hypothetical protein